MEAKGETRPPEFLSMHPDPANRIKNLKRLMHKAMEYYNAMQGLHLNLNFLLWVVLVLDQETQASHIAFDLFFGGLPSQYIDVDNQ